MFSGTSTILLLRKEIRKSMLIYALLASLPPVSDSLKLDRLICENAEFGKLVEGLTSHADGGQSSPVRNRSVYLVSGCALVALGYVSHIGVSQLTYMYTLCLH